MLTLQTVNFEIVQIYVLFLYITGRANTDYIIIIDGVRQRFNCTPLRFHIVRLYS